MRSSTTSEGTDLFGHRQHLLAQLGEEVGGAVADHALQVGALQQRRFGHGHRCEPGQRPGLAVNAEHACPLASVRSTLNRPEHPFMPMLLVSPQSPTRPPSVPLTRQSFWLRGSGSRRSESSIQRIIAP
jgi:hypothetical protein